MAKKIKGNKQYQQNTNNVVQVNSRTYGKHIRAARGSKTPATINVVLAAHAEKTSVINSAAKAVYDVLKFYSGNFREGQLWQNILGRMRKAKDIDFENLLSSLNETEINSRYGLKRFSNVPMFTIENKKRTLLIEMKPFMQPRLNKSNNCYKYALLVLMFNSKGVCLQHAIQETKWLNQTEVPVKEIFHFKKPADAKYCLLCLHLQGGENSIANDTFGSQGMALIYVRPSMNKEKDQLEHPLSK